MMSNCHVVIVGGGAAGVFAAITCAEKAPGRTVCLIEKSASFLSKVRISGGGRCNVTHACFDPSELSLRYPRGGSALRSAFQQFQPRDTIDWFAARGVELKTEGDGRMFPVTNSSKTIVDCLLGAARKAGVGLLASCGVREVTREPEKRFGVDIGGGERLTCEKLMLATGGCRGPGAGSLAVSLGHSLEFPVPSLFAFDIPLAWLNALSGISVPSVALFIPALKLREEGSLLITHSGLSGPAILKLSSWGARELHALGYRFLLKINWIPTRSPEALAEQIELFRKQHPARLLVNTPFPPLPMRLWQNLVTAAGLSRELRWSAISRGEKHQLVQQLTGTELQVTGKTLNQDEFVTCGGVRLKEINFKTMESRVCPGLFFGGELLDIDGITGGFNFQSAWTTGWIAGKSMQAT